MLRDQYRSAPRIVDYISRQFYGGRLRAAGDVERLKVPATARPGLAWTDVTAPTAPQTGNVNPAETKAIVAHLEALLRAEGYGGSVGVITPFRPQAVAIDEAVRASLPAEALEKAGFRAGTVDSFQGQERDLILFSPCLGPASAASAVQFVQRDWRRLNVAISRARALAHVFGDLSFARSGKVTSLARLAAWATEPPAKTSEGLFDSDWERRVYEALKARGLEPVPQYEIAGRRLDFALFGANGVKLDLEVDGRRWHLDIDGNRKRSDLWRDHQLKSLGWRVRRFWVDDLSRDMEGCIDLVERDLA
jgi:very-short-patch-repair endonuclease